MTKQKDWMEQLVEDFQVPKTKTDKPLLTEEQLKRLLKSNK